MLSRAAISLSAAATSSACARLSSWHGPAMIEIGKSLPNLTGPAATIGAAEVFAFKALSFFRRDHVGQRRPDQPTRGYSAKVGTAFATIIRANCLCRLEYQGCAAADFRRHPEQYHLTPRGNCVLPLT